MKYIFLIHFHFLFKAKVLCLIQSNLIIRQLPMATFKKKTPRNRYRTSPKSVKRIEISAALPRNAFESPRPANANFS